LRVVALIASLLLVVASQPRTSDAQSGVQHDYHHHGAQTLAGVYLRTQYTLRIDDPAVPTLASAGSSFYGLRGMIKIPIERTHTCLVGALETEDWTELGVIEGNFLSDPTRQRIYHWDTRTCTYHTGWDAIPVNGIQRNFRIDWYCPSLSECGYRNMHWWDGAWRLLWFSPNMHSSGNVESYGEMYHDTSRVSSHFDLNSNQHIGAVQIGPHPNGEVMYGWDLDVPTQACDALPYFTRWHLQWYSSDKDKFDQEIVETSCHAE
jgi:hypothetical protein